MYAALDSWLAYFKNMQRLQQWPQAERNFRLCEGWDTMLASFFAEQRPFFMSERIMEHPMTLVKIDFVMYRMLNNEDWFPIDWTEAWTADTMMMPQGMWHISGEGVVLFRLAPGSHGKKAAVLLSAGRHP